ncbi:MAG: DegV family protein [Acutalibacteraceae bacterium]|jgi:DegV family protein with EDD domain
MAFTIMTDTSANLPTRILKKHGVAVIPFVYTVNGDPRTCLDTDAFDGAAYYQAMREGMAVTTSQINPQQYLDAMGDVLASGNDLLFIGMSSGISGSFHMACLAAEELREEYPARQIRLIDTLGASLGEGILVLKAVRMRDKGASLEETWQKLDTARHRMCQIFTVDDLMHLRKTGRLSGAVALVGTMLQIKPLLKGNEKGQIVTFSKVRGRKRAIEELARRYAELVKNAGEQIVGIAHADCPQDAGYLESLLRRLCPPREILTVCYEPVTGSHVGPGTLALFFEGADGVRGI